MLENYLEGQGKKIPGKNFYRLNLTDAIQLMDKYAEAADALYQSVLEKGAADLQDLASEYYHRGNQNYINKALGAPECYENAIGWYIKAHDLGHPDAKNDIADCYTNLGTYYQYYGINNDESDTEENLLIAIKYYHLAKEFGSKEVLEALIAETYYDLGFMFHISDEDEDKNYKKAVNYYKKAEGNSRAIMNIGSCFLEGGHGIIKDIKKAITCFQSIPMYKKSFYELGRAFTELNDIQNARENYEKWILENEDFSGIETYYVIKFFMINKYELPLSIKSSDERRREVEKALNYKLSLTGIYNYDHPESFNRRHYKEYFDVLDFYENDCLKLR